MATKDGKRTLTRQGRTKQMPLNQYPKVYEVRVEYDPETGESVISRRAENFSGWELYGLLRVLMKEIECQLLFKPDEELKFN